MAYPTPGVDVASYDKTANTYSRNIDNILYPMICAKSQLISRFPKVPVDGTKFEWEVANTRAKTFVADASGAATDIAQSATGTHIGMGTATGLPAGTLLRNVSRATPVGTYGADEVMRTTEAVSGTSAGDVVVKRNYANAVGSTVNEGSTAHVTTDTYEILTEVKHEGSQPDENKYTDVSLEANYTQIMDFYLAVTG